MQIAIVGAGFSPGKADSLRRAMAAWRRTGKIAQFGEEFMAGMAANGYPPDFAKNCFAQIQGFAEYGFPESHAASFALLVYASCWLKCHYPDVFACALLNSQPMGFYAPSQIIRDAVEHGVGAVEGDPFLGAGALGVAFHIGGFSPGEGAALHELLARLLLKGGGGGRGHGGGQAQSLAGEKGNEEGGAHGGFLSAIADWRMMRPSTPSSKRG